MDNFSKALGIARSELKILSVFMRLELDRAEDEDPNHGQYIQREIYRKLDGLTKLDHALAILDKNYELKKLEVIAAKKEKPKVPTVDVTTQTHRGPGAPPKHYYTKFVLQRDLQGCKIKPVE